MACKRLQDALIAVWGEIPDEPLVQPYLERGPAGWVLVNLACQPGDVLVVGAGRRGALAQMALSKVNRYCLAHAQCPVLAIPPPALASELRHGRQPPDQQRAAALVAAGLIIVRQLPSG